MCFLSTTFPNSPSVQEVNEYVNFNVSSKSRSDYSQDVKRRNCAFYDKRTKVCISVGLCLTKNVL